jgi:hypothetical protein
MPLVPQKTSTESKLLHDFESSSAALMAAGQSTGKPATRYFRESATANQRLRSGAGSIPTPPTPQSL